MELLSIYTPTFNRAKLLPRLFQSLCRQTQKDFIWLVIDDGSTDNTREIIEKCKYQAPFKIEYYYKKNEGVHTARDYAYRIVRTELIMSLDSDDWLVDNSVEVILCLWREKSDEDIIGIFAPTITPEKKSITSDFPDVHKVTYQDFTYKYKVKGDKCTILRSSVIKSIPNCPIYPGEKLIGEGYKWIQLPLNKYFLLTEIALIIVEYQKDGYSKSARQNFFKNPHGSQALYMKSITHSKYLKPRIKGHIGYIIYSLYLKDKDFIRNSPNSLSTLLFLPIGVAAYLYAMRHWSKDYSRNRVEKDGK